MKGGLKWSASAILLGGQILDEFWTLWINEFLKGIYKKIIREVFVKLLLDSFGKLSIRVEEKMTLKEVDRQTVEEIETKIIAKDGTITRVPRKFQGGLASMITWIMVDALYKMAPTRRNNNNNDGNPDIAAIIAQQLQNIIPEIVTQVTNNVNNGNNNNDNGNNNNNKNENNNNNNRNGGNNGCTYKAFQSCNPKEYDWKGGAIVLTRWMEKMENVIDNSGCAENQKVRYAASSLVNKALTWWNAQV
ncbi:hypothetical protein Tco_0183208 [Tanacetum coccineum]